MQKMRLSFSPTRALLPFLGLALALSGCASGPVSYDIRGEADSVVNRDAAGQPLSVVVRLYQLSKAAEFNKLTFETLASGRPDSELLGEELVAKSELVLVPGQTQTSTDKMQEQARYLGVVAFFRTPDLHYWRYLIKADAVRSNGLVFKAQDCYLTLINQKATPIPGQPESAKPSCASPNMAENLTVPARPSDTHPAKNLGKGKTTTSNKRSSPLAQPTNPLSVERVTDRAMGYAVDRTVDYAVDSALQSTLGVSKP